MDHQRALALQQAQDNEDTKLAHRRIVELS